MSKTKYQHALSTVEDKVPKASDLKLGEIAVNLFAGKETLYVKNSNNNIIGFPSSYSKSELDNKLSSKQDASGMTSYATTAITNSLNDGLSAHTADTTVHLTQGQLSTILIETSKICKIIYGGRYSSIITLRGDAGGLYSVFYVGGYGASTVRNNATYVIKNNIGVYTDSTASTTLYIKNNGNARQRLGMITLVGYVDTIEIISSLPSTAQEIT